jgi:hypothetical protein
VVVAGSDVVVVTVVVVVDGRVVVEMAVDEVEPAISPPQPARITTEISIEESEATRKRI